MGQKSRGRKRITVLPRLHLRSQSDKEFFKKRGSGSDWPPPVVSEHDVIPTELLEKTFGAIVSFTGNISGPLATRI